MERIFKSIHEIFSESNITGFTGYTINQSQKGYGMFETTISMTFDSTKPVIIEIPHQELYDDQRTTTQDE